MSILDIGKMCTFSKVSGVILNNGEPVVGATVLRESGYQKKVTDQTTTDEKGYFEMPAKFERTIAKYLPMEFVAGQTLTVEFEGESHSIWRSVKRSREENSESKGKPIEVKCDLQNEEKPIVVNRVVTITKCDWNVEPDEDDFDDWKLFSDE
ncbi:MAG: DUF6795 domain-containing protein [Endozoicomonas sp.]|uniref:DUF6795 domain-containing protein n=1 Tax=Endozoicomonas sp. TaxID=1892382 RepID=UPI003D9B0CE9